MLSNYTLVAPEMCGHCFIYNIRNVSLQTVADISRAYFIRLGSTCWWTLNLWLGFALLTSLVYLTVFHSCFLHHNFSELTWLACLTLDLTRFHITRREWRNVCGLLCYN